MSPSEPPTLKQRVLRAGRWTLTGYGLGQLLRLVGNLVMTRLLVPEMFGVMAIAMTVTLVLGMLSDLGLRQNIVQSRRGEDPVFLDTAWVFQIMRGVLLWLMVLVLSICLHIAQAFGMVSTSSVYASSDLPLVMAVNSISTIVLGFQSTRMSTAHRRFDQKRIVQIALASQLVGLVTMIAIATVSRSIWALVAGGQVSALTTTALSHLYMSGHANRFRWDKQAARELFGFGKWVFLSSGLYVLAMNGDRLLLGAFADTRTLGLYAIASLLIGAVAGTLNRLFFTVSLPALSEIARDAPGRLRHVYARLGLPSDILLTFLTGFLFALGETVIYVLYDPRYADAGAILEVLALSLLSVRYEVARQVYLALGLPQYGVVLSLVRFIALYSIVPALFYFGGAQAAIWGVALHGLLCIPVVYAYNATLGLNNFRRDVLVLVALPVGFFCGTAVKIAL
jgi:O-antigen/teichoic acid export membrane protein